MLGSRTRVRECGALSARVTSRKRIPRKNLRKHARERRQRQNEWRECTGLILVQSDNMLGLSRQWELDRLAPSGAGTVSPCGYSLLAAGEGLRTILRL